MSRNMYAIAAAALLTSTGVQAAFETGQFTCENVGELAAYSLQAKQSGISYDELTAALDQRMPAEAQIERQVVAEITTLVYQNQLLDNIKPEEAYAAFTERCMAAANAAEQGEDQPRNVDREGGEVQPQIPETEAVQ
jgi:hypothetical protein